MSGVRKSACDACRRRRVRCDGKQPCDRCGRSGVSCTFGSLASRTSATSYARRLEQRIAQLESMLPHGSRDVLNSPHDCQREATEQVVDILVGPGDDFVSQTASDTVHVYRHYAAVNILRIVADLSGQHLGWSESSPMLGTRMLQAMDLHTPLDLHGDSRASFPTIPSEERFHTLLDRLLATALLCHDCLDQQDIVRRLPRLYAIGPEKYSLEYPQFVALVYAIIACGRRYSSEPNVDHKARGVTEFRTSCALLDHNSILDLNSIRTLILQSRFLMSLGRTSAAYTIVSTAAAAARRMGLDKTYEPFNHVFASEERFRRRQVFAVLYMMDTYFDSILGMPKCLNRITPSQQLGLRDEDLGDEGAKFLEQNPTSSLAETVLCQKLYRVHVKMLDREAPISANNVVQTQAIPAAWVGAREEEISEWADELPTRMDDPSDKRATNAQLVLRLHQAAAQITLYRPFLHHLGRELSDERFDSTGFGYASKCVQAAAQSIWLVESFQTYGIFHGAIWFNTYALAFSATILCYFVICSKQRSIVDESIVESINAATRARDMLKILAKESERSSAFCEALDPIVESLHNW